MDSHRPTILVVDDDPLSLLLIEEYLADSYRVVERRSARDGLSYLEAGHRVQAIVLDRMMPEMDGIALMAEIRARAQLRHIPVVMQSAASDPIDVTEGIASGVFYYLSKPFSRAQLRAVLANALRIYSVYEEASADLATLHEALQRIDRCQVSLRVLEEVNAVSLLMARLYPEPAAVALGVREMVLNAVEHGNAGISYGEKTALYRSGTWQAELERRLALPENRNKRVAVTFERRSTEIVLTIEDGGEGFDWRRYLALDPLRITDNHGRGIALSLLTSFDRIQYVAPGNQVICTKRLS